MLASLSLIFLVGLSVASLCQIIKLPRIIGILITGIVLGPYALDYLSPKILDISSELREMALIIILIKAGLALNISDLKKVGRPAILMSFLPAVFELIGFVVVGSWLLGLTYLESAIIGAVLGAVSPAIVVPKMIELIEQKKGTSKSIPQLILAGSSLDDVFVIVVFDALVGMARGSSIDVKDFLNIPVSITLGILLGALFGYVLARVFEGFYRHHKLIRNSLKIVIVIGCSFLLMTIEEQLKGIVSVSGLLAIMSMASVIQMKSIRQVTERLSAKVGKLWLATELILFVLVGAAVDIRYTVGAGLSAVLAIFIALGFRSVAVLICMIGTKLNMKERLFCVIAYIPKATVQAVIGAVPLAMGLPCGKIVLSVAVLSILLTAPLGAVGMDLTCNRFLETEKEASNAEKSEDVEDANDEEMKSPEEIEKVKKSRHKVYNNMYAHNDHHYDCHDEHSDSNE